MLDTTPLKIKKETHKAIYDMLEKFEIVFEFYEKHYGEQYDILLSELKAYREQNIMGPTMLNMYETSEYKELDAFIGMIELIIQELEIIYNQSKLTLKDAIAISARNDIVSLRNLLISELRKKQIRSALGVINLGV